MPAAQNGEACSSLPAAPRLDGKPFLDFGTGWALSADKNQWKLCRRRMRRGAVTWQPLAFVASDKRMLARVMTRKGVVVAPEAEAAVHAFFSTHPIRFKEWVEAIRGQAP